MAHITWTRTARSDLERILRRIAHEASPQSAIKWAAKLREAVSLLEIFPEIGSPVEDVPVVNLRERIVGPYRVIYRYDGTACYILTIPRAEQDLRRILTPGDLE